MADVTPPAVPDLDRSGRDASRSPMHWDAGTGAGFTTGTPWLPLGDPVACNVAGQRDDPRSLLALYRDLIEVRHASDAIGVGDQRQVGLPADVPVVAFVRSAGDERRLVVVNTGPGELTLDLVDAARGSLPRTGTVELSTVDRAARPLRLNALRLAPHEGLIARL